MIPLRFLARALAAAVFGLALQAPPLHAAGETAPAADAADAPGAESAGAEPWHEGRLRPAVPEPSPLGDFLAGIVAEQRRDTTAAAEFYLKTLRSDPGNETLRERTFLLLCVEGRFDDAAPLAAEVAERVPQHQLARLVLVAAALHDDNFEEARRQLAQLGQEGPARIAEPLMRAWLTAEAGNAEAVRDALDDLSDLEQLSGRLAVHEGLIQERLGNSEAADAAMSRAAADTSVTSFWLLRLTKNYFLRHGQQDKARAIADGFAAKSDSASLIAVLREGLDDPTPPPPQVETVADGIATVLFDVAQILSGEEASEGSLFYAHLALWLNPEADEPRLLVGELLQRQGRPNAAIAAYRKVREDSPYHWSVGLRIASELQGQHRDEEAITLLEQLAAARPDRFEPYYELGNLHRGAERFEQAAEAYEEAVARLGPERTPWTLFYFRGIAYERTGQWEKAEADFNRALELEPEQPYVLNYLAYSWIEQERNLEEARKMLERAVSALPDDGYIVDSLGWVYYRLGRYGKAVESLEKAVALKPQDPVINDHLGDAYWRTGRKREARVQWRRALSLEPEAEEIPKIERKLEEGPPAKPQDI